MTKRFLISSAASAILALATGGQAMAADVNHAAAMVSGGSSSGPVLVERADKSRLRDLVMEPGSDPSSVQVHFKGAQRVSIVAGGILEITTAEGNLWHYRPEVYQIVNGKRHMVVTAFHIMNKDHVALRVTRFDASVPVVFGPVNGLEPSL